MATEKRLFAPTGKLLNGWMIHAHKCRDRHDEAARHYAKGQYALGIPSLIVSTIVGTSVFSALASNAVPSLWVGVLSISAAILSALQTFLDFGGRSDKHRNSGVKYKTVIRQLEQLFVRRSQGEELSQDELNDLRAALDALEDTAPVIMPSIYDRVEKKYQEVKYVQEAVKLYAKGAKAS